MRSKKSWTRLVAVLGVLAAVASVLNGSGAAYARGTQVYTSMMDKAVYQGIYKCYKQTDDTIVRKLKLSKYDGLKSLVGKNAGSHNIALITGVTSNSFFEGSRYKVWDGKVSCKNLFLGNNTGVGGTNYDILTASGKKAPDANNGTEVKKFMQNMGYTISGDKSGANCYNAKFTRKTGTDKGTYNTNGVCKNGDKLSADNVSASSKDMPIFKVSGSKVCLYDRYTQADINGAKTLEKKVGCSAPGNKFDAAWLADFATKQCTAKSWCANKYTFSDGGKTDSTKNSTADRGSDNKKAALAAIRFLSGDSKYTTLDSIKVTEIEKRLLYQQYLTSYYGVEVGCSGESGGNWSSTKINWLDAGSKTMKQCVYDKSNLKKSSGSTVNGVSVNNYYEMNKLYLQKTKKEESANLDNLLAAIGELPAEYTEEQLKELDEIASSGVEGMSEEEQESTCAGAGGSRSLGWVVCPILEWLGDAAERTYNEYVEPSLQVSPKLFSGNGDATLEAWGNFRDMANVVFVIAILAVIFSQLTGVGIDNYGIKRILPKLIVVAVLINLSYVLCLLAVDVSNILGNSFQALFNGMADGITAENYTITAETGDSGPIDAAGITGLTGVGILGGLVAGGMAIWASPAILLSLLVAAVGIVISVFFLFILLATREAAIVVLVIVSPVAMIMYALPNTKKIFDKWLKALEGLLLVYPICGLLVGAGGYVSKLLIYIGSQEADGGGQNFIFSFMAMIVSVVPIFFIPMLLRGSFSAMGNIGARISGFGQRMSRGAMGSMQRSEAFRNAQERGREIGTMRRAGIDASGNPRKLGTFGTIVRGGRRNVARNRAQYRKDQLELAGNEQLLNDDIYGARLEADQNAMLTRGFQEQFANMSKDQLRTEANSAGSWLSEAGGQQRMAALVGAMEANGMEKDIFDTLKKNDVGSMAGVMGALAGSNNKVLKAYGKRGKDVSYEDFIHGTAADPNASLSAYAAEKGGDFVNGLDDKALEEIRRGNDENIQAGRGEIMSTEQLVQAARNMNDESSMKQVNHMLQGRTDVSGKISGEDLANFNDSTVASLAANPNNSGAIKSAAMDLAANQQLASKVNASKQQQIVSAMNNTDLLDFASSPQLAANNSFRMAAEAEYNRRAGNNP